MKKLYVQDVLKKVKGEILCGNANEEIEEVSIDTRTIKKGDTYYGLRGENVDGSIYCKDAINKGAKICFIKENIFTKEELEKYSKTATVVLVENVEDTLLETARIKRSLYDIPVIGITGSDGKTIAPSNYTVSYSPGCKNVGHYKATIAFKGNYSGTVTKTFNINPKGTKLSSVKPGKKKAAIKWKKQTKYTKGYKIQYSAKKNFKSGVKTKTVKGSKKTSLTIKGLKSKKTYYFRVRAYKLNGKKKVY